ncbi:hypothetical protein GCM10027267_30710 [Paramicrobacterium agarici]
MTDPEFHRAQMNGTYDARVRDVNEFCDVLICEKRDDIGEGPHVAPHYNAAHASILALSSNPGPMAGGQAGSGFLSHENDDGSAERMNRLFKDVGLSDEDVMPWNAYPWQVHDDFPNGLVAAHIDEGIVVLRRLLEIAPKVRVVVAHGGDATWCMRKFRRAYADFFDERKLVVIETRHTSNRAFILPPEKRLEAEESIRESYREAMRLVGLEPAAYTRAIEPDASPIERAIAALEKARNSGAAPVAAARGYVGSLTTPSLQKLAADLLVATIDT